MQVTEESANGLERKIIVQVPAEKIDGAVMDRLKSLAKTARINGFRPGKVPLQVVRKRYGGQVRQEVLGDVINESYQEALKQSDYRPAGMPSIEPVNNEEQGSEEEQDGFQYRATFEVYPEISVNDLDGKVVEKTISTIESDDLDEMIETLRKQKVEWIDVDRPAADGDQVTMDFVGSIDGEEFPGGTASDAPLELGSNSMIPGFEEQLIGVTKGGTPTISVNFPDDYRATDLAGKEAQFQITVNAVKAPQLPEVDEDFVKSFGIEEGGVEAFRADIQKNMERELNQHIDNLNKQVVLEQLLEQNNFDIPNSMVKDEIGRLRQQIIDQMQGQGAGGTETPTLADEIFQQDAEKRVKLGLLISEIIQKNEIKPDPDKVRSTIESIASTYEDPSMVVDYYYGNAEYLQNIEGLVLEQQVTEWALRNANVTDKPMKYKEVMSAANSAAG